MPTSPLPLPPSPSPPPRFPYPPNSPPPNPAFPPIESTLASRLIYFPLAGETAEILATRSVTGWQPTSLAILDSDQGYPDSALVEARLAF